MSDILAAAAPLRLDWATPQATRSACEHWHYSQSMPPPPHVSIGVWERGRFVGVVLFARGASAPLLKPYGIGQHEGCELVRVALTKHETPVTRIIAIAIRMLRKAAPGLRLIVSFADPAQGHHGGIYQGGGWVYSGESSPAPMYRGPDGKLWHSRMVAASGTKIVYGRRRAVLRPDQCERVDMPPKHRYLMPLDAAMRAQVELLRKAAPRRDTRSKGGTSLEAPATVRPEGVGGSTPTRALHDGSAFEGDG